MVSAFGLYSTYVNFNESPFICFQFFDVIKWNLSANLFLKKMARRMDFYDLSIQLIGYQSEIGKTKKSFVFNLLILLALDSFS